MSHLANQFSHDHTIYEGATNDAIQLVIDAWGNLQAAVKPNATGVPKPQFSADDLNRPLGAANSEIGNSNRATKPLLPTLLARPLS